MYYLYSIKMQGWWSGYNYTSDLSEAKVYDHVDAISMAVGRCDERGFEFLPVAKSDLDKIKDASK